MKRQRRPVRAPDMTSLFDVLFILVFVSLVNVGVEHTAAEQAEAKAKAATEALASASALAPSASALPPPSASAPPTPSAPPVASAQPIDLTARGATLIVRVDKDGVMKAIERDGAVTPVDEPLLVKVDDPDVLYEYRGDRSREHRICAIVVAKLGVEDLSRFAIVITTDESSADTNVVLGRGIKNDRVRCADEQKGFAVLAPGAAPRGDSP